jgi:hypothetical protein
MSVSRFRRLLPALSIVLPTPVETSFLRACLGSGAPARQAWVSYRERVGDLRTVLVKDRRGLKKLMPLLLRAVEQDGLDADPSLLTVLRTAHLRATLRSKTVRHIVEDVLRALTKDGIPHVILDGVALVEVAYADPAFRHCSTIDLLMRGGDRFRAMHSLAALTIAGPVVAEAEPITLRHDSGLPVELRSQLVLQRDHPIPLDGLLAASTTVTIGEIVTRVLSPPDRLLDICLRAFFRRGTAGLGWVPDAWHLLHRSTDLDWDTLLDRSRAGNLALPLLIPLRYLAAQLDAPVPAAVLEQLWQAAAEAEPIRVERALGAAVGGTPNFPRRLLAIDGGWGSRFAVAKWLALPSRDYLRANYALKHAWQLPFYYLYRPLRFVAGRRAPVSAHPPDAGG